MISFKLCLVICINVTVACSMTAFLKVDEEFCNRSEVRLKQHGYNFMNQSCYYPTTPHEMITKFDGSALVTGCAENKLTFPIFYSEDEFEFTKAVAQESGLSSFCFEEVQTRNNASFWNKHKELIKILPAAASPAPVGDFCLSANKAQVGWNLTWIDCSSCKTGAIGKLIKNPHCQSKLNKPGDCHWSRERNECKRNLSRTMIVDKVGESDYCKGNPCPPAVVTVGCPFNDRSFLENCAPHLPKREAFCRRQRLEYTGDTLANLKGVYYTFLGYYSLAIFLAIITAISFWCEGKRWR